MSSWGTNRANTASAVEDRIAAELLEGSDPRPCPRCGTNGVIDFLDLVRGRAELHCPSCPTGWAVSIDAPMSENRQALG